MAEAKTADTYAKVVEEEAWRNERCMCGSLHFRVVMEHAHRNVHLRITCVRCGEMYLGLWAADWQIEQVAWEEHPAGADDVTCLQCGGQLFALKIQNEGNFLRVCVACNKCGRPLMKFGALPYQFT